MQVREEGQPSKAEQTEVGRWPERIKATEAKINFQVINLKKTKYAGTDTDKTPLFCLTTQRLLLAWKLFSPFHSKLLQLRQKHHKDQTSTYKRLFHLLFTTNTVTGAESTSLHAGGKLISIHHFLSFSIMSVYWWRIWFPHSPILLFSLEIICL